MKKKRKKKTRVEGGGCFLVNDAQGHACHICHLVASENPKCNLSVITSLDCIHYIEELGILHDCALLCLGILCHSCSEIEVHVEKLKIFWMRFNICKNSSTTIIRCVVFLQMSSKVPHRQGFRPH